MLTALIIIGIVLVFMFLLLGLLAFDYLGMSSKVREATEGQHKINQDIYNSTDRLSERITEIWDKLDELNLTN